MDFLAFLTAAGAAAVADADTKPAELPTFRPRWWHREDRLDARPVMWSLRNRPEEWEWRHQPYTITHRPSKHTFWVGNGWGFYSLYDADCSCTRSRGRFQRFQQGAFGRAFRQWRRQQAPIIDQAQFAAHFVRNV